MFLPSEYVGPLGAETLVGALELLEGGPEMVVLDPGGTASPCAVPRWRARAFRGAAALQERGIGRGDRVLLALQSGPTALAAMLAVALAGGVMVPFVPPGPRTPLPGYQAHLVRVLAQARPRLIWCEPGDLEIFSDAVALAGLETVVLTDASPKGAADFEPVAVAPDDLAMMAFTSGSMAAPKGVLLTHGALMANVRAVYTAAELGPDEVFLQWVPLETNFGFMFAWMALLIRARLVWMPAIAVLSSPRQWLYAIHHYRATFSVAPNFLYQAVVTRLSSDDLAGLDLSCWRTAGSGGEPVLWSTVEAFTEKLAPFGFPPGALRGGYGMTEVTFGVAYAGPSRPLRVDHVDAESLERQGMALPARPGEANRVKTYVSMGRPVPGVDVRVVDPLGKAVAERQVGEIQVKSPARMVGYLDRPLETEEAFDGDWHRSGDLGYMIEDEIVVVGRRKELIVKNGRKIVPQDLERLAAVVPGVHPAGVVAFGVPDSGTGTEAAVLVAETSWPEDRHEALAGAIARTVWEGAEVRLDHVSLVAPGAVPRTPSNKVQRLRTMTLWMGNQLEAPAAEESRF